VTSNGSYFITQLCHLTMRRHTDSHFGSYSFCQILVVIPFNPTMAPSPNASADGNKPCQSDRETLLPEIDMFLVITSFIYFYIYG
jgi:hypothetical protein